MLNRKFKNIDVSDNIKMGRKGAIVGSGKELGIKLRGVACSTQAAPATATTAATLTAAQLLTGILNATPTATGATVAYTLPTGTLMDSAVEFNINDSFDWVLINTGTSSGAVTLVAGTGHTIVGAVLTAIGTSSRWRTVKTATNTYITYRIG